MVSQSVSTACVEALYIGPNHTVRVHKVGCAILESRGVQRLQCHVESFGAANKPARQCPEQATEAHQVNRQALSAHDKQSFVFNLCCNMYRCSNFVMYKVVLIYKCRNL